VKYRDGMLQDMDRPLNPKTRKVKAQRPKSPAFGSTGQNFGTSKDNFYNASRPNINEQDEELEDSFAQHVRKTKSVVDNNETLSKVKG